MNFPNKKESNVRRVGIMGGTFNPIHIGHLLLAENAYSAFGLDQVLFIPSGCSYMKEQSGILDADIRLYMTELATADNPHFQVSDIEIRRGGYTYTCETLRAGMEVLVPDLNANSRYMQEYIYGKAAE